ncbi:transcriptional regulator [Enterococcus florum]|uniref:Transcriptional regulator n=1 Tax=Enterococcus florum TaxID=2480627 RepID=A0A4P5PAC0_9ENTE|nr:helix-turn-helix transcriptional regulator [Enterococcus florum]GCF95037.1 transcriptional regulator [Enterococcus florum]
MEIYEKIKTLAAEKKISIRLLEETLGFGNGVINRWRKNTPGIDKIEKVADFFDVSVDYLLGRSPLSTYEANTTNRSIAQQILLRSDTAALSEEDAADIEKEMERFLNWRLQEIERERREKD